HSESDPEPSRASGDERPEDRAAGNLRRRADGDEDARRDGRSAGDGASGTSARRDAARVRQGDGTRGGRGLDAGRAVRVADDLLGRRQAVHHRRDRRRRVLGRVRRVQPAGGREAVEPIIERGKVVSILVYLLVFLLLLAVVARAQPPAARPPRDLRPTSTGTAVSRGRVFPADTGKALR